MTFLRSVLLISSSFRCPSGATLLDGTMGPRGFDGDQAANERCVNFRTFPRRTCIRRHCQDKRNGLRVGGRSTAFRIVSRASWLGCRALLVRNAGTGHVGDVGRVDAARVDDRVGPAVVDAGTGAEG